jgi:hypothetical protein
MAIELRAKRERAKTITIDFDGDPLNLEVYTNRVTDADVREIRRLLKPLNSDDADQSEAAGDKFAAFLCSCLKSIDLTLDGQPLPVDVEVFKREIPVKTLNLIIQALVSEVFGVVDEKKS